MRAGRQRPMSHRRRNARPARRRRDPDRTNVPKVDARTGSKSFDLVDDQHATAGPHDAAQARRPRVAARDCVPTLRRRSRHRTIASTEGSRNRLPSNRATRARQLDATTTATDRCPSFAVAGTFARDDRDSDRRRSRRRPVRRRAEVLPPIRRRRAGGRRRRPAVRKDRPAHRRTPRSTCANEASSANFMVHAEGLNGKVGRARVPSFRSMRRRDVCRVAKQATARSPASFNPQRNQSVAR